MDLSLAEVGKEYVIKNIETEDEELNSFLFSLGCYTGESITVISHLKKSCVVAIKDARYNIDIELARAIKIWHESVFSFKKYVSISLQGGRYENCFSR